MAQSAFYGLLPEKFTDQLENAAGVSSIEIKQFIESRLTPPVKIE